MKTESKIRRPENAAEMLRMARDFLARNHIEEARLEAELLVAHALTLDRLQLFLQLDRPLSDDEIDRARDLLVRRGRREPVAYIIGRREFYGRSFQVGTGVLIPRPETELLVDRAREIAAGGRLSKSLRTPAAIENDRPRRLIADVGTGSGCIAITLALEIANARVVGVDVSAQAIEIARSNAAALGASVELECGDAFGVLARVIEENKERFDLVVANPPYVAVEERASLAPEVREHEPELALFAPRGDPDHWVRLLLEQGREWLKPEGALLVELGKDQAPRALAIAAQLGWRARVERDLAGIERVIEARP